MRKYFIVPLLFLVGCDEKEETYPAEPVIAFTSIEFLDPPDPSERDSLIITFSFTDGDSDFGLDERDLSPPFNQGFFVHKSTGELISFDKLENNEISVEELIRYSDKQNPPYDTLPEMDDGCFYQYFYPPNNYLYTIYNENYTNVFVDFFYEDVPGNFVEFDFLKTFCETFDSRVFSGSGASGPFIKKMTNEKKGQIQYSMLSFYFKPLFQDKKMKLKIYIQDRALNRSNILETPEFYLSEI